jgi:hypothetical protein
MRWLRGNRRYGGLLALAAMVLQLVLSFGHLHLDKIRLTPAAVSLATSTAAASHSTPAQPPAKDADDYCAICAVIHLASSSFLPEPPKLPLPVVARAVQHLVQTGLAFVAPHRTAFRSRAPPLA